MRKTVPAFWAHSQRFVHWGAIIVVTLFALAMIGASLGAAFGRWPWLGLNAQLGAVEIADAGIWVQLGLTGLALTLAFFLPGAWRLQRLEDSHRDFQISMDDVTRAYRASHEADRARLFKIGSEFDSVRERIRHLRDHPDLGALEPEVLELAAQMSHVSRDIADVYSAEKVERARLFLTQRQEEVESFLENLAMAKKTVADLKHWMLQVETEEGLVDGQLTALEADLLELLPQLGFELEGDVSAVPETVVPMRPGTLVTPRRPVAPASPEN